MNVEYRSLNGFRDVVSTGSTTAMRKPSTSGLTTRRPPKIRVRVRTRVEKGKRGQTEQQRYFMVFY